MPILLFSCSLLPHGRPTLFLSYCLHCLLFLLCKIDLTTLSPRSLGFHRRVPHISKDVEVILRGGGGGAQKIFFWVASPVAVSPALPFPTIPYHASFSSFCPLWSPVLQPTSLQQPKRLIKRLCFFPLLYNFHKVTIHFLRGQKAAGCPTLNFSYHTVSSSSTPSPSLGKHTN